jgi:ABC-type multidrug transport system ATPase subunit
MTPSELLLYRSDRVPVPAVRVRELVKQFGAIRAVRGVSFDAATGAVVALVGCSGSGKSTVLQLVLGLIEPDSGRVQLGARWNADRRPRVLVFDEPSSGLDPQAVERLGEWLGALARAGNAVLVSATSAREVTFADELVVMDAGRVIIRATVDDLLAGAARASFVDVRTPQPGALADALAVRGHACFHVGADRLRVHDLSADALRGIVGEAGLVALEIAWHPPELDAVIAAYVDRSRHA